MSRNVHINMEEKETRVPIIEGLTEDSIGDVGGLLTQQFYNRKMKSDETVFVIVGNIS